MNFYFGTPKQADNPHFMMVVTKSVFFFFMKSPYPSVICNEEWRPQKGGKNVLLGNTSIQQKKPFCIANLYDLISVVSWFTLQLVQISGPGNLTFTFSNKLCGLYIPDCLFDECFRYVYKSTWYRHCHIPTIFLASCVLNYYTSKR